jgi:hypothetical protein
MKKILLTLIFFVVIIAGCTQQTSIQTDETSSNLTQPKQTDNLTQIAIQNKPFVDIFISCKDIQNATEKVYCFGNIAENICDTDSNKALELCMIENKTFAETFWGNGFCVCAITSKAKINISEAFKICNEVPQPTSIGGITPNSCSYLVSKKLNETNPDKAIEFCKLAKESSYLCCC